ncbi:MAG: FAD-binding oxidoreductase [Hyphomicrobiaceae bacterium]
MTVIGEDVLAELQAAVGPAGLKSGEAVKGLDPGINRRNLDCGVLVLPGSTAEVQAVVAIAGRRGIGLVPQGGRTGLAGAAVTRPGEIAVGFARMARIEALDAASGTALVEAGVTLGALARAAGEAGLSPGIDLGARDSCTIGGMIGTNAGGMEAFRFGTMRQRVLGLEAVLADGTVVSELTGVRKANTGYDLKSLMIGAEGTLGIVTRAVIGLVPCEPAAATGLVALEGAEAAVALLKRALARIATPPLRAEIMWAGHFTITAGDLGLQQLATFAAAAGSKAGVYVILEIGGANADQAMAGLEDLLGAAIEDGLVVDALIAKNEGERRAMWQVREDWAVDRYFPGGLWFDVSVPLGALGRYAEGVAARLKAHDPALQLYMIGHLGDGNLHVTVNARERLDGRSDEISPLIYEGLEAEGGAFSAEHGIGLEKQASLLKRCDPGKLKAMQLVKRALDPGNIMNPGKVLPR